MLFSVMAASVNSTSSDLVASYATSQVVYIGPTQVVCRQLSEDVPLFLCLFNGEKDVSTTPPFHLFERLLNFSQQHQRP